MKVAFIFGTNSNLIIDNVSELLDSENKYNEIIKNSIPYGIGKVSELILNFFRLKL